MSGMDFLGWPKLVPGQTTYKAWYLDRGQWSGLVPCQVMNCFRTAIHPANCAKKVYSAMRACANWTWSDIWIWNCFRGLYSPGVDNSRDRRDKIEARHEGIGHQAAANRLCVLCSVQCAVAIVKCAQWRFNMVKRSTDVSILTKFPMAFQKLATCPMAFQKLVKCPMAFPKMPKCPMAFQKLAKCANGVFKAVSIYKQ